MTMRKLGYVGIGSVTTAAILWLANAAVVQAQVGTSKDKQGVEVTMTGRVVDLNSFMTGEWASEDHARCTADCIRNGVPAALDTTTELVILGRGISGPGKALVPLAFEQVEVRGKLFEKNGTKYLDITSISKKVGT